MDVVEWACKNVPIGRSCPAASSERPAVAPTPRERLVIASEGALDEDGVVQWALRERDDEGTNHLTLLARVILTAAAIVALVGVGFTVGTMWQPTTQLSNETGKLFLQAIFIVAVGAVVAFLVEALRERRVKQAEDTRKTREQKAAAERPFSKQRNVSDNALLTLDEFIDRLDATYLDVKRVRRVLAAKAKPDLSGSIGRSEYWTRMLDMNEQQIILEQLTEEMREIRAEHLPELVTAAADVGFNGEVFEDDLGRMRRQVRFDA